MPELPEVETVVRDLRPLIVGRRIVRVRFGRKQLRGGQSNSRTRSFHGRTIRAIDRRGKWIIVKLDRGAALIHLGMTGQLTVGPPDRPVETHTHVTFDLHDGGQLRFRDIRRFGSVAPFAELAELHQYLDARLGPEPFAIQPAEFRQSLLATKRALKAALLDQTLIAGVGNIYADESLFVARLSPHRRGCDLKPVEIERLRKAIVAVLRFAIDRRGSSIRNYVGGSGLNGEYQREFRVYGRTGEPCPRCRSPIAHCRLAGRSTHYCLKCQAVGIRE